MSTHKPKMGRPKDLDKRHAILQAATELFLARGYTGVSMMDIAQQAGVSKLTLYSHFTDKENLFEQAVMDCCEQQLPASSFQLRPDIPPREALVAVARGLLDLVMDERSITLHRMMIKQTDLDTKHAALFFRAGPEYILAEMQSLLRQAHAQKALTIPNAKVAAEHFFCLLKGVNHLRVLTGLCNPLNATARKKHAEEVVSMFMRAYQGECG